jgi:hypothetical protein
MSKVAARLRGYWKMEAANVALVPSLAAVMVLGSGGAMTAALFVSMVACSALLIVGTLYWRAALRRIEGDAGAMARALVWIDAAEPASLLLTGGAVLFTCIELAGAGFTAVGIGALVLTVLAVLEYVNYYKIQLQHFDHAPDIKRFLAGKGFRKAHMARELEAWRRRSPTASDPN